jgi:hypothetical protein
MSLTVLRLGELGTRLDTNFVYPFQKSRRIKPVPLLRLLIFQGGLQVLCVAASADARPNSRDTICSACEPRQNQCWIFGRVIATTLSVCRDSDNESKCNDHQEK